MVEVKYEHPLEYYTVDNFIKESRKLIGTAVHGVTEVPAYESAEYSAIACYTRTLGDKNPLYTDLDYAIDTRYAMLIAPPTFLTVMKYPMCEGTLFDGPYPLAGFEAAFDWEWSDVVRMNDGFATEHVLKDVYEKPSDKGRTVYLVSECKYLNKLSRELVATCRGTYAAIARAESITDIPEAIKEGFSKQPITDRKVYCYSDEEVERLSKEILDVVRRGNKTLYWEDAKVGDKLPQVAKGPLNTAALLGYHGINFSAQAFPAFGVAFRKWLKTPGYLLTNPLTGWPYDTQMTAHGDPNLSGTRGMPYTFAMGSLKAGFCIHLLSNWMGDDGFIRRLSVDVLEPYIYGDALWIKGRVVDKYKEKLGGTLYGAVDVKIEAVNQLGQNVAPGTATVYLPSISRPVELPIPK